MDRLKYVALAGLLSGFASAQAMVSNPGLDLNRALSAAAEHPPVERIQLAKRSVDKEKTTVKTKKDGTTVTRTTTVTNDGEGNKTKTKTKTTSSSDSQSSGGGGASYEGE